MRQNDHLTEQRQIFIKEYCALGDHVEAARRAGYSEKTIANQACKLKRELASEIREELTLNFIGYASGRPKPTMNLRRSWLASSVRMGPT
jgi:hypothetical protein